MILVDEALKARAAASKPIRVGLIGAGFMAQGLTNQVTNSVPGMEISAIFNRAPARAARVYEYAGLPDVVEASDPGAVEDAIRSGRPVVTDDAFSITQSENIDVIVDVTGSVEFGARVALDAFENDKDVVLMNAELDGTVGPVLRKYAARAGRLFSACNGDEPGVQMDLVRWVVGLGLIPRVIGNVKGLQDPYRNPTTQQGFAEQWGQNPTMVTSFADGTKVSFEQSIVANATGFQVRSPGCRGAWSITVTS